MAEPAAEETHKTVEIDLYFERSGVLDGWTMPRVKALCRAMNCSPFELGKLCAVDFKQMNAYMTRKTFPPTVCLHMANLEATVQSQALPQKIGMPMHLFTVFKAKRRVR